MINVLNVLRLTVEQVEELWQCLVVRGSSECADCLYSWLLSHTKSPDQHALGLDALRFLYVEKMPTLDPEVISVSKEIVTKEFATYF